MGNKWCFLKFSWEIYTYSKEQKEEEKYPCGQGCQYHFRLDKSQEKPMKTNNVGDLWSKIAGLSDALLCSSVYRLYYEAIQYYKSKFGVGKWVKAMSKNNFKTI